MYGNGQGTTIPTQYPPRFQSRSATATPTGSPKKRQLPQIPQVNFYYNLNFIYKKYHIIIDLFQYRRCKEL